MKLIPVKKETPTKKSKVLEDMTQEIKELKEITDNFNNKLKEGNRKIKKTQKQIKRKRFSSESSFTSDVEMLLADTDDSEYETMNDIITTRSEEEEEENIKPSIPFGISDIEYFTEDDKKFKTDSWILAKFTTKRSVKHFVGKVLSMKYNVPEVKFVRKKKESKFHKGLVFSYPTVDDICTMQHLDDVILVLPDPNISRRGQIIFNNIDLSNYNVQ